MHDHGMRRFWLTGWMLLLLLAAGCFQPAGGGLEATNVAQSLPTFTPFPSETPSPLPLVIDVPTEVIVLEPPTLDVQGTQIAALNLAQLDPLWQTATAVYMIGQGQQPINVVPLEAPTLDPLLQQATDMVRQATETAGAPMTQTAQAIIGFPTATFYYPAPTAAPGYPTYPAPSGADCIYEVQPGDTNLYRISLKFGVSWQSIASASNLVNPNLIHVGDRLVIPGCGTTGYVPPPTSTPGGGGIYPTAGPPPSGNCPPGRGQYTVVAGDTLFALSIAWGTTVNTIAACNAIPNVNLIYIGQTLYMP